MKTELVSHLIVLRCISYVQRVSEVEAPQEVVQVFFKGRSLRTFWYWNERVVCNVDTECCYILHNYYEIDVIFKLINCMFLYCVPVCGDVRPVKLNSRGSS